MSIKSYFQNRKKAQRDEQIITKQSQALVTQEIAFMACVNDMKPVTSGPDAGYYVWINKNTLAQGILIGRQDKLNPMQHGYDKHYKINTVSKILTIAKQEKAQVLISHKYITISREIEAIMLKTTKHKSAVVKRQIETGEATTSNITYNSLAERDTNKQTAVVYDGDDHYSWFAMPVVVTGHNKLIVDKVVSRIRAALVRGGIRCEIPQFAQLDVIKAALPTNQINAKFLQPVNNRTIMSMLPLKNPDAAFPKIGPVICTNAETMAPIKLCPTPQSAEGTIVIGPPGSGKTTLFCNLISHAIGLGYHVKLIEPKNEDSDGTDYINFCNEYDGGISRWGPDGVNPNLLTIYYDKAYMGTSPASYRKAKDDWFEVVQNAHRAWMGGLNERQSGLLTKLLIDIYKQRGVIDEDGNPINTELWDVPGALAWPSEHEFRSFWKEMYEAPGSIYYHDPSVDALIMNTMNAEPGGTLWWWANSHEHMDLGKNLQLFDISQLPDNMKSAVSIQIMGACNSLYFPKPANGHERVKTLLIFDEVRNLSQTKELVPYMERSLTEGRAPGITPIFGMQNPLKNKEFMDTLKSNCKNLIILDNLDEMNIDIYMDTFKIQEKYRSGLLLKGCGHGHYFRNRRGTKIRVEVDEMPTQAVLESKRGQEIKPEKAATALAFGVEDAVREIYENEGFFIDNWVIGKAQKTYPGFTDYRVQDPLSTGRIYARIRTDKIKFIDGKTVDGDDKQDKVGVEGYKHYSTACILSGWINQHKLPNATINHSDKWDIESGNLLCIEIEGSTNHTVEKLNEKLKAARSAGFKHIIFTGTGAVCNEMMYAEGSLVGEYVYPYGNKLLRKLEEITEEYRAETQNQINENLVGFSELTDGMGA